MKFRSTAFAVGALALTYPPVLSMQNAQARSPLYFPACTGVTDEFGRMFGFINDKGEVSVIVADALCDPSNNHPYRASYNSSTKIITKVYYAGGKRCYDGKAGAADYVHETECSTRQAVGTRRHQAALQPY